ncbi:hypothetical protein [Halodesulfovibrio sp. MK-HDV]|uniref:DUF4875 domain-containing protein n=1 Tax=unclassified Halodesulfovibrio TaxID=2644657 RepID=UPI0013F81642|nr:hypothetical protein [Halodesulfovibrio sp. MK-HDV]KAF1076116.1 hypothetical protein MKHDV_01555 [Halodesulfovibrio sp. MK-HDV]
MLQRVFLLSLLFLLLATQCFAALVKPATPHALPYSVLASEKEEIGGLWFHTYSITLGLSLEAYSTVTSEQIIDTAVSAVWDIYQSTKGNSISVAVYVNKEHVRLGQNIGSAHLGSGSEHVSNGWGQDVCPIPPLREMQITTLWYELRPQYMVQGCYGMELDKKALLQAISESLDIPVEVIEAPESDHSQCFDHE